MAIDLSSISRTTRNSLPPRVVIHGPRGVGKSTLGASAYKPVFLPIEDGLSGIEVDAFPLLTSYADVLAALSTLATKPNEFGTVVLDSLDWLEPLVWAQVCADHQQNSIEDFGYGRGYLATLSYWQQLLDAFNYLRRERGMAVILIAHSEIRRFNAPDNEPYDRYQIKLHKLAADLIQEWADITGFAQFETIVKSEKKGFKETSRGIGTGRRFLHVVEKPAYVAKNRYAMPDTVELSWNALVAAMSPAPATPHEPTTAAAAA